MSGDGTGFTHNTMTPSPLRAHDWVPRDIFTTGAEQNATEPGFTDEGLRGLEITALVLSVISVFCALVAFYWFVRMRRSFRQE